ncbi:MAG: HlyC/CorC family transporter [Clostridia bacterium]|nr:HlyC/CorC family transporter [Clostridia bacterium]
MSDGILLGTIFLLLLFSAGFSASEMAFNSANKLRLKSAVEDGRPFASLADRISENFGNALCAILIGNNLSNIGASTCATMLFIGWLGSGMGEGGATFVSTVVLTLIVLLFCEIMPKVIAKQHADSLVLRLALPVRIVTVLLFPVVFTVMLLIKLLSKIWGKDKGEDDPTVTEDELSLIIETAEEEGVIDEDKNELLQSTLTFHDTIVREIMTPRTELTTISLDDLTEAEKTIEESQFSRIPVCGEDIDDIVGILLLKRYYKDDPDQPLTREKLESMLIKPLFIHKTMRLPVALDRLRRAKTHMAIVIDEFGGTMGIVTVEDILEELVGDIWDENEEITVDVEEKSENIFDVSGDMNISDFFDAVDVDPGEDFESEYTTVGGWATEMLNAEPELNASFTFRNLKVTVTGMDDLCVTSVRAEKTEQPDEEVRI